MGWDLRLHGVGNAAAVELGSAMATIERNGAPWLTIDCGGDGAFALKVLQQLVARDVFVRKPMAPGLDRCIRVSAAPEAELAIFEAELPAALAAARG